MPLPTEEAAHPYGTPAFMGLPARLCALQGERLRTDGVTMSCTESSHKERLEKDEHEAFFKKKCENTITSS